MTPELRALAQSAGVDYLGWVRAEDYDAKAPAGHRLRDWLPAAKTAVVIGIRLLDAVLEDMPRQRKEYTALFHTVNYRLNDALLGLGKFLQARGHLAYPILYKEVSGWNLERRSALALKLAKPFVALPALKRVVDPALWGEVSYKHLAAAAGLGELGVSDLLLAPGAGARARWGVLLTDADLGSTGPARSHNLCRPDECAYACVRACPVGAIPEAKGGIHKARCLQYYLELGIPSVDGLRCGLCVAHCPAWKW
jgi:epoxyqueuosine reductase QueG